jgi:GT2 family glycosyltransferase
VELTSSCVASILSTHSVFQEYLEIIVVEDSGDKQVFEDLSESMKFYPRVGVIARPNGGFAAACNTGLKVADGDVLFLVNNDIEFELGQPALMYMYDAILAMRAGIMGLRLVYPGEMKIQHGGVIFVPVKDQPIPGYFDHYGRGIRYDAPEVATVRPSLCTGAVLGFRRNLIWGTGYLDEEFGFACEDIDFELRCIETGQDVVYFGYSWAYHKEGGTRGNTAEAKLEFSPELVDKERKSMLRLFDKWDGIKWEQFGR